MASFLPKTGSGSRTCGMILGKFLPPHRGHEYLVNFARHYVDDLTVLTCSIASEPIPGELRYRWMRELFPDVRVVHVTDENPQEPKDHPDFWNIWRETILRAMPEGIDYVFASEDYGWELAKVLNAEYIPVDHPRELIPVSGTQIRENPMKYWDYIPPAVRPYFVKRVCVFGPESTGKSTLAKDLAKHFNTVYVAEYARGLLDFKNGQCDYEDIPRIARGHIASEDALARHANRVIFSDTDVITTTIWSDVLFQKCPEWIAEAAEQRTYDLYLLTHIDVPWVDDSQRFFKEQHERESFFNRCREALEKRKRPYVIIDGSFPERFTKAVAAVSKLIA